MYDGTVFPLPENSSHPRGNEKYLFLNFYFLILRRERERERERERQRRRKRDREAERESHVIKLLCDKLQKEELIRRRLTRLHLFKGEREVWKRTSNME